MTRIPKASQADLAMANPNSMLLHRLSRTLIDEVSSLVDPGEDYVILDFPDHSNIGDSAIYLGEAWLLERIHGKPPVAVTAATFDDVLAIDDDRWSGPIYLHGGGNFGDLYYRHQAFREQVIRRFRHRRIIQLPQTIHFRSSQAVDDTAELIGSHPDYTLLVRDRPSFELASAHFACAVRMVPDAAFAIEGVARQSAPDSEVVCLMREDIESTADHLADLVRQGKDWRIVDWPPERHEPGLAERVRRRLTRTLAGPRPRRTPTPAEYRAMAEERVARGLRLLSRGQFVLTDRLHAHILSLLLGIPHVALDNSYGKIRGFAEAWTSEGDFVQVASVEQAVVALNAMAARQSRAA